MSTPEAEKAKGNEAFKAQNWAQAIKCFTAAIDLDVDNASGQSHVFYSNRSAAYLKYGDATKALVDADACVALKPDWPRGHARRGAALGKLGRAAEARAAYKKGLSHDPANAELQRGLAEAGGGGGGGGGTAGGGGGAAALQRYVSGNPRGALLLLLRLLAAVCAAVYLFPLTSRRLSFRAFKYFAYLMAANCAAQIYQNQGRPRFDKMFMAQVMRDPAAGRLFFSLLLLTARPTVVALVPLALVEFLLMGWELASVLPAVMPAAARALGPLASRLMVALTKKPDWATLTTHQQWAVAQPRTAQLAALGEVVYGILLLAELLTPRRSFLAAMLYWQFMQMRVMVEKMDAANGGTGPFPLQNAFGVVDKKITGITQHRFCPALIGKLYGKVKAFLQNQTKLPAPGEQAQRPKCTIM